ncbi:DUF4236 domain-containing protein [Streptomyces sp. NPDC059002]|uniref:DUF4236 domain-containing protein n=1 Tax=Streptomyces sp. NPDC059002 TaxID=3346690 RepID=UPI0036CD88B6
MTASKSGIGMSAGVPGARVTKRADGRVQTTVSVPGTGLSHTSAWKRPKKSPTTPAPVSSDLTAEKQSLEADYRTLYRTAVQQMRDNGFTAEELMSQLQEQGLTDRYLLGAVREADKYLKSEAKKTAKKNAEAAKEQELDELARGAAKMLREGMKPRHVDAQLKEHGVGMMARGEVISRAKKFNKQLR